MAQAREYVGSLLTLAFFLAILAVCLMALITMVNRFRTNLLGDEGYIMFTLPASVHQQVWSKLIVSTVWYVLTAAVVVLSFLVAVFEVGFVSAFFRGIEQVLQAMTAYYTAYQQYSSQASSASSKWTEYANGLYAKANISIYGLFA